MIKTLFSICVCVLAFVMPVAGQSASFLSFPLEARTAGLGHAGYALTSPFATQGNTAAIMTDEAPVNTVATSYLKWQPETVNSNLFRAGGYKKMGEIGLSAGFYTQGLPTVRLTDDFGNDLGPFKPTEYSLELGMGYKLSTPLSVGVAFRYIHSDMGGIRRANAFATDFSMLYHRDWLKAGLGLTNIGTKVNYGHADYSLPTRIRAGAAFNTLNMEKHRLVCVADLAYQLTPAYAGLIGGIGAEYGYGGWLFVRGGTHFESQIVGTSYSSMGFGVQIAHLSLDVAHLFALRQHPGQQAMVASLSWAY